MYLTTLGTGSKGNSYILKSSNGKFCVLDCGLKMRDITSSTEFDSFKNLDFVFSSHEHKDHSLSLEDFERSGAECISYKSIVPRKKIEIGQWEIFPFTVLHNAVNYGIIIYDKVEEKKLVYATDFIKMPKIQGIDYWLYEINYDKATVDRLVDEKELDELHIANNVKYHNSLEDAVDYFKSLNNKPKLVIACHLSNMGGCDKNILQEMKPVCDRIEIAKKNKTFRF